MESFLRGLDFSVLADMLYYVIPAFVCITLHEVSHGYVAYRLGDPTARRMGRLTLNPLKHLDVFGLLMMVVVHFGWAKPVPVDMRYFRHPKRDMALTALAGPVCNFLITVFSLLLYGACFTALSGSAVGGFFLRLLATTGMLSISLCIFNFLPIPPLDGSKILFSVVSDEAYEKLMRYEKYGMILLVILMATGASTSFLSTVVGAVYDKLFGLAELTFRLVNP